jgi:hypothetical protein
LTFVGSRDCTQKSRQHCRRLCTFGGCFRFQYRGAQSSPARIGIPFIGRRDSESLYIVEDGTLTLTDPPPSPSFIAITDAVV